MACNAPTKSNAKPANSNRWREFDGGEWAINSERIMVTSTLPKSYLSDEEREELAREGDEEFLIACEAQAAREAGDGDTSWAWLVQANFPPTRLKILKDLLGGQFIKDRGFKTAEADALYGADWLERD